MKYYVYSVYLEPLHLVHENDRDDFEKKLNDIDEAIWTIEASFDNKADAVKWMQGQDFCDHDITIL